MTTRFSLAELADMLHVPVQAVRHAVETLSDNGELTAESFMYQDKNWRVAPSDVKRIKSFIEEHPEVNEAQGASGRRVKRITVRPQDG